VPWPRWWIFHQFYAYFPGALRHLVLLLLTVVVETSPEHPKMVGVPVGLPNLTTLIRFWSSPPEWRFT
jgi:hypothetical protein